MQVSANKKSPQRIELSQFVLKRGTCYNHPLDHQGLAIDHMSADVGNEA